MAEIVELRSGASGLDDQVFSAVSEMEGDLRAIDEFADALALVSETMDESPHANAINRLAWEIKHRTQSAERRRGGLSRLTRLNRATRRASPLRPLYAASLAPSKMRLIRCTVPGSTPKRFSARPSAFGRPGQARA
jgi:hypothetical protein